MSEVNTTPEVVDAAAQPNRLLNIGRAWVNTRNTEDPKQPKLTVILDRDLGIKLTVGPSTQFLLFANPKREGINPNTQQPYQDPEYRVAISLPSDVVDREIARQEVLAREKQAASVEVH